MSLLEDVFLEDEANEAEELERVIEGDEFDERPRSRSDSDDNSEREGEAEEEKKRVDPTSTKTTRVIKNPRFILNPARLTGPRGIHVIPEHFKDFKFKGKNHEKEDLDLVLKKLEHWAYRLYPKFKFEDCLKKIETLGKKRPVMVNLHKIRTDQYMSEETVVQRDSSDDEAPHKDPQEEPPEDEFDKLLQQQIEIARSTPAPSSVKKGTDSAVKENRSLMMPKATSSPSISDEQRERILKSRKLAEERRLARLKIASSTINGNQSADNITNTPSKTDNIDHPCDNNCSTSINTENGDVIPNTLSKSDKITDNRSIEEEINNKTNSVSTESVFNIKENYVRQERESRENDINSSDEDDIVLVNESIRADVHTDFDKDIDYSDDINQGPKKSGRHKIDDDDDVILEIDDSSSNDQENDNNHKGVNLKTVATKVDGLENNVNTILETDDNDKEFGNLDDNSNKGADNNCVIITENSTDDPGSSMNVGDVRTPMTLGKPINDQEIRDIQDDRSVDKFSDFQVIECDEKDCIEVERNRDAISDDTVKTLSEKALENNVDELMDVDFDDEF
ncbi:protein PFC0760c [Pararge aegeria]|uniref:TIMELESS-interacting protein n=5 Tax=Pararge aegeria TaxID=116150 RepID=A0A8S4RGW4_9NEOP|nr:protein PFC0760c [Pararge aegeria]CAH2236257.1 jg7021 [Pararge aegeria aegeria]